MATEEQIQQMLSKRFLIYAERGSFFGCEELLDTGAQVNYKDELGHIAIHRVIYSEDKLAPKCIQLLIERGADLEMQSRMPVAQIVANPCNREIIEAFAEAIIARGMRMPEAYANLRPLREVWPDGRVVRTSVEDRIKRKVDDQQALIDAVIDSNYGEAKRLLDHGVNVETPE